MPPGDHHAGDAAFGTAMHDPRFISKASKTGRPLNYASGEEMIRIIHAAAAMQLDIEQPFIKAVRGEL